MNENKLKIILITGMSGIRIEYSLQKFISNFRDFRTSRRKKPELIKLDTEIENVFYKENPLVRKSNQVWKDVILKKSYPVFKKLWESALEQVMLKLDAIIKENKSDVVLINLHSCYYHNKTQEYVSLLNLNSLSRLNPSMVVTFIDDIYDIHQRLTDTGGIFHDETNVTNTQMILRLFRLLDWRAKEIMISKFISQHLNVKNYIFAVKHSFETLSNLIFEDFPVVYLSHPITEVRRLEKQNRLDEASKIMGEITQISDRLTGLFTTFLPTTIDEYRITSKTSSDGVHKDYYSVLQKRWESEQYINPKDFLYINSGFTDTNELWKKDVSEIGKLDEQINHLLDALSAYISDQVTTRDYSLVEQSDILVIYRPIFNGNASGGVREEFRYYKRLKEDTAKEILCFVYCPRIDIEKYFIKQFELKILNEIKSTNNLVCRESEFSNLTTEECSNLLNATSNKLLLLDVFDEVLDNHKIDITIRNEKTPLGENAITEFKHDFVEQLKKNYESIGEYKSSVTYYEESEITIEEFINRIKTQTKN